MGCSRGAQFQLDVLAAALQAFIGSGHVDRCYGDIKITVKCYTHRAVLEDDPEVAASVECSSLCVYLRLVV